MQRSAEYESDAVSKTRPVSRFENSEEADGQLDYLTAYASPPQLSRCANALPIHPSQPLIRCANASRLMP